MEIICEKHYRSSAVKVEVNDVIINYIISKNPTIGRSVEGFVTFIRTETTDGVEWYTVEWYTVEKVNIPCRFDNLPLLNHLNSEWNKIVSDDLAAEEELPLGLYHQENLLVNHYFPIDYLG